MDTDLPDMNLRTSDITDMKVSASDVTSRIGDMEFTDEELKRFVKKHVSASSTFLEDSKPQPKQNGYGVSVAMLAWSLAFLLFPKFVVFPMWLAYCFYAVGFVALLVGILGLSIEVFKGKA